MASRTLTYFAADVHLGLDVCDKDDRERRFVSFLRSIPRDTTKAVYLLGDIWDFWYEYRDVVPKGYVRVFGAIADLLDSGVEVNFFPGNHDIWCYSYFESLGMKVLAQPYDTVIGSTAFCLGHGDGLGPGMKKYKFLKWVFHNRFLQACFSTLHPWIAFRLGNGWSKRNRLGHEKEYVFRNEDEPLWKWAAGYSKEKKVDVFVFGHFHAHVDEVLPTGARLIVLKDWIGSSPYLVFDSSDDSLSYHEGAL